MQNWKGQVTLHVDLRARDDDEAMELLGSLIRSAMETTAPARPRKCRVIDTRREVTLVDDGDLG